jgi:hypothetical protein
MTIKIIYFFLIYTIFGLFVYWATGFSLSKSFEEIIWILEGSIIIPFSIFLWINIKNKNINYELNSIRSFAGYIGIVGIVYGLIHISLIYPTTFLLHKFAEKIFEENVVVVEKRTDDLNRLVLILQNEDLRAEAHISLNLEKKIKLNDKALVTGYKSFFGSTVSTVNINR